MQQCSKKHATGPMCCTPCWGAMAQNLQIQGFYDLGSIGCQPNLVGSFSRSNKQDSALKIGRFERNIGGKGGLYKRVTWVTLVMHPGHLILLSQRIFPISFDNISILTCTRPVPPTSTLVAWRQPECRGWWFIAAGSLDWTGIV